MRNKFYKAVAIFIAVNMMSFTVFATEGVDFGGGDGTPSVEENTSEPESAPASEPESAPASEPESAPASEPESAPASEPQSAPASEPESAPASEPQSAPASEPESTPASEPQSAPAQEQSAQTTEQTTSASEQTSPATEQTTPAQDQPAVATEQPAAATEQPAAITDQPAAATEQQGTNGNTTGGTEQTQGSQSGADTVPSFDQNIQDLINGQNPENFDQPVQTEPNVSDIPQDDQNQNGYDELQRRVAQNQEEVIEYSEPSQEEQTYDNWSMDGNIEDVMGIRAGSDGDSVVIEYKTKHTNDWDYHYQGNDITVTYTDASGETKTTTFQFDWDGSGVHGNNWTNVDGAVISKYSDQTDTEIMRLVVPSSYFGGSTDVTVSSGKYTASTGNGTQSSSNQSPVYTGIAVDGTFNDWNAVQKSEMIEPEGQKNVESTAMVIDNDYVYIYLKDDGNNSATWAGPNSNGKYAITTDLGRTLLIQLNEDGAVVGAEGAVATHNGSQWEIAIPTSSLPANNGGIEFGLYMEEASISGYANVDIPHTDSDIAYDGNMGDWVQYPHKLIEYSTAGTHENVPDGEASIYVDNNVYGHCETRMQSHLDEQGGEFTQGVSIAVNDDWNNKLEMRLATVDDAGNINWNPQKSNLENGTYEYYIFDVSCWGTSQNISNLNDADVCYGKATIEISEGKHEMEWYVDSRKLAAKYGVAESDLKTVSSKYIRIGDEAVTAAGASSGPWAGAALCVLSALAPFVIKKKFCF